ncbi:MAG TPA: ISL3 family transposase [Methylotenera sp.]|nr:ISL3 family transposase [Methylotenera sp.]
MPANILNLPSYTVTALQENDHDYHIDAIAKDRPERCPHCQSDNLVGFGRREQMVKDLPMQGKRVGLYVETKRFQCRSCTKTFYESLPDVDEKRMMTSRLAAWVGKQAIKRTFASIAEDVGINEGTVRSVFRDYINELESTIRFDTPKWMGIDEVHLIKPRGVITNIENNTVVELLANRNKETIIKYLYQLEGKQHIQYVTMDMWRPYKDAVEEVLPQANIVIDKFHVVKMANEALERVRKSFRESLTPKQRRGLMHDRFILLKRESELNGKEVSLVASWLNNYPELGEAYRLKEDFFNIYQANSKHEALLMFADWEKSIQPNVRDAFADLIRAWRNWQPYILNYFEEVNFTEGGRETALGCHPVTNAYTESLNSLIRVMDRLGRGYSFEALRAKILFAEGAFKKKLIRPKFERRYVPDYATIGYARADEVNFTEGGREGALGYDFASFQQQPQQTEINYGVDISTLVSMIENGEI